MLVRRSRFLPFLPPLLLVVVAVAQFGLANTTFLSPWKLGGFGMFSTTDSPGFRVLRIQVETEGGAYIVPGSEGSAWTRTWPRASVLQAEAKQAVCGAWHWISLDSVASVPFPDPRWAEFYASPMVQTQTAVQGIATPAVDGGSAVRRAVASVWWMKLVETESGTREIAPQLVASEAVTTAEAGCL